LVGSCGSVGCASASMISLGPKALTSSSNSKERGVILAGSLPLARPSSRRPRRRVELEAGFLESNRGVLGHLWPGGTLLADGHVVRIAEVADDDALALGVVDFDFGREHGAGLEPDSPALRDLAVGREGGRRSGPPSWDHCVTPAALRDGGRCPESSGRERVGEGGGEAGAGRGRVRRGGRGTAVLRLELVRSKSQ